MLSPINNATVIVPEERVLDHSFLYYDTTLNGIFSNNEKRWYGTLVDGDLERNIDRWVYVYINDADVDYLLGLAQTDMYCDWMKELDMLITNEKRDIEIIDYNNQTGDIVNAWYIDYEHVEAIAKMWRL